MKSKITAHRLSVEECREILGQTEGAMTDAEIETLRNELERVAEVLLDEVTEKGREGLLPARWDTHFRLTGEAE